MNNQARNCKLICKYNVQGICSTYGECISKELFIEKLEQIKAEITDGNVYETSISNGKQKMIKVPFMKMPECCDKCDFGRCCYSHPFTGSVWADDEKAGKHGYNCQLEYYEKGRYETVREAPIDEHIVPVLCPLIKANGLENNLLSELKGDSNVAKSNVRSTVTMVL